MNNKKHKSFNKEQEIDTQHIILPDVDVPQIIEPNPVCSICGEQISSIIEAITEQDGTYSHFDCVITKLKSLYNVQEPDKVSYIGHGSFAVVSKDNDGKLYFKETIQYETNDSYQAIKKFVEGTKQ